VGYHDVGLFHHQRHGYEITHRIERQFLVERRIESHADIAKQRGIAIGGRF
jgi:hypothetical protein